MVDRMIDIVIPTYNRPNDCLRQLRRIYLQLCHSAELKRAYRVYVCDNASTSDYSIIAEACRKYEFVYRRFNVNTASVGNQCRASLLGESTYKWVLSDDDPLKEKALLKIYTTMNLHSKTGVLLFNDALKLSCVQVEAKQLIRYLRVRDPLAITSNTLISSFIFSNSLFDHSIFWSMEDRWFPLSTAVMCRAILDNEYITVIPKSGILEESDNTRNERNKKISEDPNSSEALLDKQFQSAILAYLNLLWKCTQCEILTEEDYINLVSSRFNGGRNAIRYGLGMLADPLLINDIHYKLY